VACVFSWFAPEDWEVLTMNRWRTLDIVVASVLGVAFGVVFWAWDALWNATTGAFVAFPPSQALIYGVWLLPAVLAGLIIRKPGAAVYAETVAAIVGALLGNSWGAVTVPQGIVEGLGVELVFLAVRYRDFRLPVAIVAGAAGGLFATVFDAFYYLRTYSWATYRLPYIGIGVVSCAVIAGLGGWALTRALAETGVLQRFASGKQRAAV
jgi:energy-coupling factor transport system permease protein